MTSTTPPSLRRALATLAGERPGAPSSPSSSSSWTPLEQLEQRAASVCLAIVTRANLPPLLSSPCRSSSLRLDRRLRDLQPPSPPPCRSSSLRLDRGLRDLPPSPPPPWRSSSLRLDRRLRDLLGDWRGRDGTRYSLTEHGPGSLTVTTTRCSGATRTTQGLISAKGSFVWWGRNGQYRLDERKLPHNVVWHLNKCRGDAVLPPRTAIYIWDRIFSGEQASSSLRPPTRRSFSCPSRSRSRSVRRRNPHPGRRSPPCRACSPTRRTFSCPSRSRSRSVLRRKAHRGRRVRPTRPEIPISAGHWNAKRHLKSGKERRLRRREREFGHEEQQLGRRERQLGRPRREQQLGAGDGSSGASNSRSGAQNRKAAFASAASTDPRARRRSERRSPASGTLRRNCLVAGSCVNDARLDMLVGNHAC